MAASTSTRGDLVTCLREENVLAAEVLDRVESRSNETVMPLGVILRQRGKLTMAQLIELSHMQSGNPRLRLGELAVSKGWCTAGDVDEALAVQRKTHVLDLVIAEQGCDANALVRALVRYAKMLEQRLTTVEPIRARETADPGQRLDANSAVPGTAGAEYAPAEPGTR